MKVLVAGVMKGKVKFFQLGLNTQVVKFAFS